MPLPTFAAAGAAGVLTVLSPCVLPILPIVFGAAASRHRFGPAALAIGVAAAFVGVGLFLATIGAALGVEESLFRRLAGVLLVAFGLVMLFAPLQAALEMALSPFSNWAAGRTQGLDASGPWGQAGLGVLMGAIWSPCVGPTLGAASLLASQGRDLGTAAATMAVFGAGAAAPLLLIGSASRSTLQRWRGSLVGTEQWMRRLLGGGMIVAGILAVSGLDKIMEAVLVQASPEWLTRLTTAL